MSDTRSVAAPERPGAAAAPAAPPAATTAVLFATAPAGDGSCAALLPWDGGTVLGRLAGQLASTGVRDLHVIVRPQWGDAVRAAVDAGAATVHASAAVEDDLRALAAVAAGDGGGVVVLYGDIVTHRGALAGLVADPRVATGVLAGSKRRVMTFRIRARRGRLVSAASPYHAVAKPTGAFLGALKVAAADRPALVAAAERLAPLAGALPPGWDDELARKAEHWRLGLDARAAAGVAEPEEDESQPAEADVDDNDDLDPAVAVALSPEDEARLRNRLGAAREDAVALVLVALVRGGTQVGASYLRKLFWARTLSTADTTRAADEIGTYDEDRVLLESAVKGSDGFFTTFFVSSYSRYIARWAARRGMTPNQVTTISLFIGIAAALAFATGERWGLVAGAVLLQIAFTTDCVDGQLARYTKTFSKLGAWLDSIFDRTKEYLAFAGLAIGASRAGDPVWLLACCAITLQTVRHMSDFSFGTTQHESIGAMRHQPIEQPSDVWVRRAGKEARPVAADPAEPSEVVSATRRRRPLASRVLGAWHAFDRTAGVPWVKKMIAFPIGERFAVISLTAALFTPRVTFIALLAWGGLAAAYTTTGRVLRTIAR